MVTSAELVHAAREATERARQLEARVRALGNALLTPEENAALIVQSALTLFGASAAVAMRLMDDATDESDHLLLLDGSVHVAEASLDGIRSIPLSADDPMAEAVRTGHAVVFPSRVRLLERYPHLTALVEATETRAFAAVPVRHLASTRGALAMFFRRPREFSAPERAQLRALGARYARAIHQARLYFSERDAHVRADAERQKAERVAAELVAARDELQSRVRNRTQELARTNAELVSTLEQRSRAEEERRLLRLQLTSVEEDERRRIARELHDQLGQHLTALRLGIDEVGRLLEQPERARARLEALQELAGRMTHDVRHLALDLRPPELDDLGLASALETYVHDWSKRFRIAAELAFSGRDTAVPAEVGTALYRIVQEALTNVVRHAKASAVGVVVEQTDTDVRLIVEDDGQGFDMPATQSRVRAERRLGLAGMRERASVVGGTLTVESSPGRGTTVYVCLPLCPSAPPP